MNKFFGFGFIALLFLQILQVRADEGNLCRQQCQAIRQQCRLDADKLSRNQESAGLAWAAVAAASLSRQPATQFERQTQHGGQPAVAGQVEALPAQQAAQAELRQRCEDEATACRATCGNADLRSSK